MTQPLFVFGVTQRSGTHLLYDLLLQHADCAPVLPATESYASRLEDWLFHHADAWQCYLDRVGAHWRAEWEFESARPVLLRELGAATARFLIELSRTSQGDTTSSARYVVTKTPSVHNLDLFLEAMPGQPAVVIVRDGRDVAESGHRTWGQSYERWFRIWRQGAQDVLAAMSRDTRGVLTVVRYEDLVTDLRGSMRPLLRSLGLDEARYDWAAAESLPVTGSSVFRPDHGKVSWEPVPVVRSLLGERRREQWPVSRQARFAHLAGEQMTALGYDLGTTARGNATLERLRDALWAGLRTGRRLRDVMTRRETSPGR